MTARFYSCSNSEPRPLVGLAPRPEADPLVGLVGRAKGRTRGSGADEGVRPTVWLRLCCFVGQVTNLPHTERSHERPRNRRRL